MPSSTAVRARFAVVATAALLVAGVCVSNPVVSAANPKKVAPSFTISLSPTTVTIGQGLTKVVTLKISRTGRFTGKVGLSAVLSAGLSLSTKSNPVAGKSTNLTLRASVDSKIGNQTISIRGRSGAIVKSVRIKVRVVANQTGKTVLIPDGELLLPTNDPAGSVPGSPIVAPSTSTTAILGVSGAVTVTTQAAGGTPTITSSVPTTVVPSTVVPNVTTTNPNTTTSTLKVPANTSTTLTTTTNAPSATSSTIASSSTTTTTTTRAPTTTTTTTTTKAPTTTTTTKAPVTTTTTKPIGGAGEFFITTLLLHTTANLNDSPYQCLSITGVAPEPRLSVFWANCDPFDNRQYWVDTKITINRVAYSMLVNRSDRTRCLAGNTGLSSSSATGGAAYMAPTGATDCFWTLSARPELGPGDKATFTLSNQESGPSKCLEGNTPNGTSFGGRPFMKACASPQFAGAIFSTYLLTPIGLE